MLCLSARTLRLSAFGTLLTLAAPVFARQTPQPAVAQPAQSKTAPQEAAPAKTSPKQAVPEDAMGVGLPTVPEAWAQLKNAMESKNADVRIATASALGLLNGDAEAEKLLKRAFDDKELDVRLAAIAAAGESMDRNYTTDLRSLMDDKDPSVAFAAAATLWKMKDHSGEDILMAVLSGERKTSDNLLKTGMHHANRELHSPAALAREGVTQLSIVFLPPVGIGLGAYNYMKGAPGQNPRVQAIALLTQEHTNAVRDQLIAATVDKDTAVRIAAAEKLAAYRGPAVVKALGNMFADSKEPVRLSAYAAYIHVKRGGVEVKKPADAK